jgi:hypothetical protein
MKFKQNQSLKKITNSPPRRSSIEKVIIIKRPGANSGRDNNISKAYHPMNKLSAQLHKGRTSLRYPTSFPS